MAYEISPLPINPSGSTATSIQPGDLTPSLTAAANIQQQKNYQNQEYWDKVNDPALLKQRMDKIKAALEGKEAIPDGMSREQAVMWWRQANDRVNPVARLPQGVSADGNLEREYIGDLEYRDRFVNTHRPLVASDEPQKGQTLTDVQFLNLKKAETEGKLSGMIKLDAGDTVASLRDQLKTLDYTRRSYPGNYEAGQGYGYETLAIQSKTQDINRQAMEATPIHTYSNWEARPVEMYGDEGSKTYIGNIPQYEQAIKSDKDRLTQMFSSTMGDAARAYVEENYWVKDHLRDNFGVYSQNAQALIKQANKTGKETQIQGADSYKPTDIRDTMKYSIDGKDVDAETFRMLPKPKEQLSSDMRGKDWENLGYTLDATITGQAPYPTQLGEVFTAVEVPEEKKEASEEGAKEELPPDYKYTQEQVAYTFPDGKPNSAGYYVKYDGKGRAVVYDPDGKESTIQEAIQKEDSMWGLPFVGRLGEKRFQYLLSGDEIDYSEKTFAQKPWLTTAGEGIDASRDMLLLQIKGSVETTDPARASAGAKKLVSGLTEYQRKFILEAGKNQQKYGANGLALTAASEAGKAVGGFAWDMATFGAKNPGAFFAIWAVTKKIPITSKVIAAAYAQQAIQQAEPLKAVVGMPMFDKTQKAGQDVFANRGYALEQKATEAFAKGDYKKTDQLIRSAQMARIMSETLGRQDKDLTAKQIAERIATKDLRLESGADLARKADIGKDLRRVFYEGKTKSEVKENKIGSKDIENARREISEADKIRLKLLRWNNENLRKTIEKNNARNKVYSEIPEKMMPSQLRRFLSEYQTQERVERMQQQNAIDAINRGGPERLFYAVGDKLKWERPIEPADLNMKVLEYITTEQLKWLKEKAKYREERNEIDAILENRGAKEEAARQEKKANKINAEAAWNERFDRRREAYQKELAKKIEEEGHTVVDADPMFKANEAWEAKELIGDYKEPSEMKWTKEMYDKLRESEEKLKADEKKLKEKEDAEKAKRNKEWNERTDAQAKIDQAELMKRIADEGGSIQESDPMAEANRAYEANEMTRDPLITQKFREHKLDLLSKEEAAEVDRQTARARDAIKNEQERRQQIVDKFFNGEYITEKDAKDAGLYRDRQREYSKQRGMESERTFTRPYLKEEQVSKYETKEKTTEKQNERQQQRQQQKQQQRQEQRQQMRQQQRQEQRQQMRQQQRQEQQQQLKQEQKTVQRQEQITELRQQQRTPQKTVVLPLSDENKRRLRPFQVVQRTTHGNITLPAKFRTEKEAVAAGMWIIDNGKGTSFRVERGKEEVPEDELQPQGFAQSDSLAQKFWMDKQGYYNLAAKYRRTNPLKRAYKRQQSTTLNTNKYKDKHANSNIMSMRKALNQE